MALVLYTLYKSISQFVPGRAFVFIFIMWTIFSGIMNGDSLYESYLYFRMLFYAYLVFWAVWNADLSIMDVKRLNKLILLLWIIQIADSIYEVFVSHVRSEGWVGTITNGSGTTAAIFPMFAMGYVLAIYFYRNKSMLWVFLAFAFSFVGYASGKRAIYYYIPLIFVIINVWYFLLERHHSKLKNIVKAAIVFVLLIPALIIGVNQSQYIAFDVNSSYTPGKFISHMLIQAKSYSTAERSSGAYSSGRVSTSKLMFSEFLQGDIKTNLVGYGPSSKLLYSEEDVQLEVGIWYGVTGWATDVLNTGWLGMLSQVCIYLYLWRLLFLRRKVMLNPEAKAMYFGTQVAFLIFFIAYFTYCSAFSMAGWFTFVHFYFLALLLSPKHRWLHQLQH